MTIFESYGTLKYRSEGWITLFCCPDLARYYQAQIKVKPQLIQAPMHGSHITVCNGRWETITNQGAWKKYQNKKIWFSYSNEIVSDKRFFWLSVTCGFIHKIRKELGLIELSKHPILKRGLHLTLARKMDYFPGDKKNATV